MRVLYSAIEALQSVVLVSEPDPEDWFRASRLLRRAAVATKGRAPRPASVALLVSEALTFTATDKIAPDGMTPLREAYRLLGEPFISSEAEENVFVSLLDHGWHTVAPFDEAGVSRFGIS